MSNIKLLKRRIRSVSNTKQITKAMELVAASKLRKIQDEAIASKEYSKLAYDMLHRIAANSDTKHHPYFTIPANAKNTLLVVFASDKGLAGSYLSGIAKTVFNYVRTHQEIPQIDMIVVGKRAAHYFARTKGINLIAVYDHVADNPTPQDLTNIVSTLDTAVANGDYADISVVYSKYQSTTLTIPALLSIFPLTPPTMERDQTNQSVFDFEPSAEDIVAEAARLYMQAQLYQARLDSAASEHAMRMLAMHAASDNASDLIHDFQLDLNTTRQTAVTSQMAEISGALAALA